MYRRPTAAVWITFDDGQRSVVEVGLPVLQDSGVPATLFVCPGLIEQQEPFWWDVVDCAVANGLVHDLDDKTSGLSLVTQLKQVPDEVRRDRVRECASRIDGAGLDVEGNQLTRSQIRLWIDSGNDLGNHSWDHPCLDRCDASEQRRQVVATHDWLADLQPDRPAIFAYPNGNWSPTVETTLLDLGYQAGLLFDHRLSAVSQPPLRLSRLRISSSASLARLAAILSGAHGAGLHGRDLLRTKFARYRGARP